MEYINKNLLDTEKRVIERRLKVKRVYSWGDYSLERLDTLAGTQYTLKGPMIRKVGPAASVFNGCLYVHNRQGPHCEILPESMIQSLGALIREPVTLPDQAEIEKKVMDATAKRFGPRLLRKADQAKVISAAALHQSDPWN